MVQEDDIVMATQLSPSKFLSLLTQMSFWKGPISAAVCMRSKNKIDLFGSFVKENLELWTTSHFNLWSDAQQAAQCFHTHLTGSHN
jgi:hypothetical protein